MKRKNTTRNALLTSIISMLLCVSMLVGATFAWFTDEVKSGINVIAAGNLDIEVTNADGDSIEDLETLFNDVTLWEPGAVAYEKLTISNEGSLALKYAMSFAWDQENHLNGHKLSDVLKVAVLEADVVAGLDMEDRDAVLAAAKAATSGDLKTFSISGSLYPAENAAAGEYTERAIHVVIYWEPSALDNLYNANNGQKTSDGEALHIDLGIVVKATQQMKEEDSFGDDYDERAEYPENTWLGDATYDWYNNPEGNTYTLTYASDLAGFANIVNGTAPSTIARSGYLPADSFKGKIVKLADNIDLNNLEWTPIGNSSTFFEGTFDGGNFTIYNLNVNVAKRAGLFGNVRGKLNNVKINGASIRATDYAGALLGQGYAYIDNCHVVNADVIVTPAWDAGKNLYDGGAKAGGLVGQLCEGGMTLKNSSATNVNVRGYRDVGGLLGMAHYGNTVTGNAVEAVTVSYIPAEGYAPYADGKLNENISVLAGRIHANVKVVENNKHTVGDIVFDLWNGKIPAAKPDTLIVDTAANLISINDSAAFAYLNTLINDPNFAATYGSKWKYNIELNADIDLADYEWAPITMANFIGFDGKGHTIRNLKITSGKDSVGLFAGISCNDLGYCTVKDLTIDGAYVKGNNKTGVLVGYASCTAENVTILNATVEGGKYVGGLAGRLSSAKNCTIKDSTIFATDKTVGGLIGYAIGDPNPSNVSGNFVENVAVTGAYNVGGLLGQAQNLTVESNDVKNVTLISTLDKLPEGASSNERLTGYIVARNVGATVDGNELNGGQAVDTADKLIENLEAGENVTLTEDVKINPAGMSNAYGTTGINVKNGQTIDGNGNVLDIKGAGGTWDSGISTTGGVIKNITITGSFRGIFINHNSDHSEKVVLENVIIDGTVYTISCDQGTNSDLEATNCTFNGWTSYAATIGDVKFVDCSFGEGQGYAYCRPYAPTEFVGCDFAAGYTVNPVAAVTFENCTIAGVPLTAENVTELVTGTANVTVK